MSRARVFILIAIVVAGSAITIVMSRGGGTDSAVPTTTTLAVVPSTTTSTSTTTTTTTTTTTLPPGTLELAALLDDMSLEEKAHQLVVGGASGAEVGATIEATLGSPCVGGVFVSKNVGNWTPEADLEAATAAIGAISARAEACRVRPLITTDAEAGTSVLKVPVSPLPAPSSLVANHEAEPGSTTEGLAEAAVAFATELGDAGVHVNLGVIADVDAGPDYYMARQGRSFGGDPPTVAAISGAIVEGHCRAGIAATLKHFPNQGSTAEDPHQLDSVSVNGPDGWAELGRIPYLDTVSPLVMTGHIRYADIDHGTPATLSAEITTGWLREGLAYEGVIITDDLHGMRGVTDELPAADRGAAAIAAGADLALYLSSESLSAVVEEIVRRAIEEPAFAERVDQSVERIVRLKAALGLVDELDPDWFELC